MTQKRPNTGKYLASPADILIMLIDYQEKLLPHIYGVETVLLNASRLVRFSQLLSMPIVVTEQYPQGLGPTAPRIASLLNSDVPILPKTTFSCFRDETIVEALKSSGRSCVIAAGIETHICVGQTVCDLLANSFNVHVLLDCVGSRSKLDHEIGLKKMHDAGAVISTLEAFMYEVLGSCEHPRFRECLAEMIK